MMMELLFANAQVTGEMRIFLQAALVAFEVLLFWKALQAFRGSPNRGGESRGRGAALILLMFALALSATSVTSFRSTRAQPPEIAEPSPAYHTTDQFVIERVVKTSHGNFVISSAPRTTRMGRIVFTQMYWCEFQQGQRSRLLWQQPSSPYPGNDIRLAVASETECLLVVQRFGILQFVLLNPAKEWTPPDPGASYRHAGLGIPLSCQSVPTRVATEAHLQHAFRHGKIRIEQFCFEADRYVLVLDFDGATARFEKREQDHGFQCVD
jgi:hypothetical protein